MRKKSQKTERQAKAKRSSDTIISVFCQCVNSHLRYFLGIAILPKVIAFIAMQALKCTRKSVGPLRRHIKNSTLLYFCQ
jgi:hypothetical protein